MSGKQEFIVICAQVVGSGPFEVVYNFDGRRFTERKDAIQHGFKIRQSDDFNIGVLSVDGTRLVSIDWMDEKVVENDQDKLTEISSTMGLR